MAQAPSRAQAEIEYHCDAPVASQPKSTQISEPFGYIIDQETSVDLLRDEAIAKPVVDLIVSGHNHSVTIGVHGDSRRQS